MIVDKACFERGCACYDDRVDADGVEVAKKEWVGLTDEEIKHAPHHMVDGAYHYSFKQGAQWAESKLKDKNI